MTRQERCEELLKKLKEYLAVFSDEMECKATVGQRYTFRPDNMWFKLTISETKGGEVQTPEQEEYKLFHQHFNLPPDGIGRKFIDSNGNKLRITGLTRRRHKYPVNCIDDETGKRWKCGVEDVRRWLGLI